MANTYNKPHVLDSGILIYPKRGWEPPPPIEGYRRKSNDPRNSDAWIFIPEWAECPFRDKREVRKEGCRCMTYFHVCTNTLVGLDTPVNMNLCNSCKHRPNV